MIRPFFHFKKSENVDCNNERTIIIVDLRIGRTFLSLGWNILNYSASILRMPPLIEITARSAVTWCWAAAAIATDHITPACSIGTGSWIRYRKVGRASCWLTWASSSAAADDHQSEGIILKQVRACPRAFLFKNIEQDRTRISWSPSSCTSWRVGVASMSFIQGGLWKLLRIL